MRRQSQTHTKYPQDYKDRLVQRYLSGSDSYQELAALEGIKSSTLRGWVNASQAAAVSPQKPVPPTVDQRSPEEKLRLLFAAKKLADADLGEFLRREGLREDDLERWEQDALGGLQQTAAAQPVSRQLREVERRCRKAEKRLREAEALLDLQKKVQALWGAGDDDTTDP